jgi:hypothetical protein
MDDFSEKVKDVLNAVEWIPELETNCNYFRTHDDCEGDMSQGLSVVFSMDGDAWVSTRYGQSCRFRMPFMGGGRSPRVRNALMILAMAIKMENDEEEAKTSKYKKMFKDKEGKGE